MYFGKFAIGYLFVAPALCIVPMFSPAAPALSPACHHAHIQQSGKEQTLFLHALCSRFLSQCCHVSCPVDWKFHVHCVRTADGSWVQTVDGSLVHTIDGLAWFSPCCKTLSKTTLWWHTFVLLWSTWVKRSRLYWTSVKRLRSVSFFPCRVIWSCSFYKLNFSDPKHKWNKIVNRRNKRPDASHTLARWASRHSFTHAFDNKRDGRHDEPTTKTWIPDQN